ncbi:electron transport complex subunit E [Ectothiorhodospira variabilis]|uniref:electron transport complex subunit E n=1 Tax=Ectothiorhodospira variabilis TaxID=505694 RepID=UPI001EFA6D3B|nr:electron transport complex subunit E [Ectothiorhodospira variabilis]MCG5494089.1 electron transport complex subunit E [Ectothiorhodospira variabilis]MCG5497978.1 electron transport complex subunit E [Ectothiorhodospira variabilis]MCG5503381.1 electron transport complex subunit E [Ectothiorhodospira variabilis]MCG5506531.1 electron transport complex subunit E [Ectothiorhodospira variabilis]
MTHPAKLILDDYRRLFRDGIWDNNVVMAQMLALCPLLAVTGTATNGLGMGLATTFVMVAAALLISMFRGIITPEVRIPVFILLIAALVTLVDLVMNAYLYEMHKALGLFIPLIVTNCAILGRAESFASRQPVHRAVVDGLAMGVGFTLILVVLGAVREIPGSGTLFADARLLLGDGFAWMELTLIPEYRGFLLMILPPGAFLALGFILAGKRVLDTRLANRAAAVKMAQA